MEQLPGNLYLTEDETSKRLSIAKSTTALTRKPGGVQDVMVSESKVRLDFDTIASGVVVWGTAMQIIEANRAAEQVLGIKLTEMQQYLSTHESSVFMRADGTPLPHDEWLVPGVFRTGQARHDVVEGYVCPDGRVRWLQLDTEPVHGENGLVTRVVVTFVDVTVYVEAMKSLRKGEERFRALSEISNDLTLILDATGRYQYASPSHRQLLGYAPEELVGTSAFDLIHPDDRARAQATFAKGLQVSGSLPLAEYRLRSAGGSWVTVESVSHYCFDNPAINGLMVTAHDITQRVAMDEALRYQAQYDGLTDLPNSTLFIEVLEQAVEVAQGEQGQFALLILDLDRFKDVNDTFGAAWGDLLLQQVGIRLRQIAPAPDTVSRLSGDEFAMLLLAADEVKARAVACAVQRALEEPCIIDGCSMQIDASIGAALYPAHATDGITLLRRADMVTYIAKQAHDGFMFYDAALEQNNPRRLALIAGLRPAIAAGELILYYQPKLNLKTRAVNSVEALVRWPHPTFGLVPPDQFIPLAEQTGLIAPLTRWVLEEAVRQCGEWLRAGLGLSVAVNLSAWNLRDIKLPQTIAMLLEKYRVPARLLCVELTESAVMTNPGRSLHILTQIFALGVHISIDDFGTGYSSLAYLKSLPVDELKIDRSFLQHMDTSRTDATIVRSTVNLAHSFGLRVVAEGVENQETLHLLTALHCDLAQGFFLSCPLPAENLEHWLRGRVEVAA